MNVLGDEILADAALAGDEYFPSPAAARAAVAQTSRIAGLEHTMTGS